jgi:hypothetical protein
MGVSIGTQDLVADGFAQHAVDDAEPAGMLPLHLDRVAGVRGAGGLAACP